MWHLMLLGGTSPASGSPRRWQTARYRFGPGRFLSGVAWTIRSAAALALAAAWSLTRRSAADVSELPLLSSPPPHPAARTRASTGVRKSSCRREVLIGVPDFRRAP